MKVGNKRADLVSRCALLEGVELVDFGDGQFAEDGGDGEGDIGGGGCFNWLFLQHLIIQTEV